MIWWIGDLVAWWQRVPSTQRVERTRSVGSGDERSVGMLTAFGGRTHAGKNGTAAYFVFLKMKAFRDESSSRLFVQWNRTLNPSSLGTKVTYLPVRFSLTSFSFFSFCDQPWGWLACVAGGLFGGRERAAKNAPKVRANEKNLFIVVPAPLSLRLRRSFRQTKPPAARAGD